MSRLAACLAFVVLVSACAAESTPTTAPAATDPTSTPPPQTTTTLPQLVDGGLVEIDPATLVPTGGPPVLVANYYEGVGSPDGRYAAMITITTTTPETTTVAILDRESAEIVAEAEPPFGGVAHLTVTNAGEAYWSSGGAQMTLFRLSAGADEPIAVYSEFPADFFGDYFQILEDGSFGFYGTSPRRVPEGLASVVIVAADGSTHVEYRLENVIAGFPPPETEPEADTLPVFQFVSDGAAWDLADNRLLVVEAGRDVVTEVDLGSGAISEHPYQQPTAWLDRLLANWIPSAAAKGPASGTARTAALSEDGQRLYVTTAVTSTEVDGTEWNTETEAQDMIVINTETWRTLSLDVVASRLASSPDGRHLLAQGASIREGPIVGFEVSPSPVYVIDMDNAEVLVGFQNSETSMSQLQFSSDGASAYLHTFGPDEVTIDVVDMELLQLTGSVTFRELSLVGPAGYMAFHLS